MSDKFYRQAFWRRLRGLALARDQYVCVVPGCGRPAQYVDHIVARQDGGRDELGNLRSLCAQCDGSIKERPDRRRKNGGELRAIGADARGYPLDPRHHWNQK